MIGLKTPKPEFGADLLFPIKGLNTFVPPRLSRSRTPALGAALQGDLRERAAGAGHSQQAPGRRRPAEELGELGAAARHADSVRHRHGEPHPPGGRHRRADHGGRAEEDPWKFHPEGEDER